MEQLLGSAGGLSPATMTRLTKPWAAHHAAFHRRDLAAHYVYVWADGIHPQDPLVRDAPLPPGPDGHPRRRHRELIAIAEGLRESTESWADLLRDCRRRGMRDPVLVVGDGAMGCGGHWRRCFRRPGTRGVGVTEPGTSRTRCRSRERCRGPAAFSSVNTSAGYHRMVRQPTLREQ
ncbi:transposase [Streptomyces sp. NPDC046685]|uniref:transposase n=1 Tax=Streptomyces sp. NPDC046685 TaxID=3157202 RepID=UPI0033EB3AC1